MNDFTLFCPTCKAQRDILEIHRVRQEDQISTTFRLLCGHAYDTFEAIETVIVTDEVKLEHFDKEDKLLDKYKTKTSGKTKRPAKETIIIDRKAEEKIHKVWEQNDRGEWDLVWDKATPVSRLKDEV